MSALDTLAAQAYGAGNFPLVGLWAQRTIVVILIMCVPFFFLWWNFTAPVLISMDGEVIYAVTLYFLNFL